MCSVAKVSMILLRFLYRSEWTEICCISKIRLPVAPFTKLTVHSLQSISLIISTLHLWSDFVDDLQFNLLEIHEKEITFYTFLRSSDVLTSMIYLVLLHGFSKSLTLGHIEFKQELRPCFENIGYKSTYWICSGMSYNSIIHSHNHFEYYMFVCWVEVQWTVMFNVACPILCSVTSQ